MKTLLFGGSGLAFAVLEPAKQAAPRARPLAGLVLAFECWFFAGPSKWEPANGARSTQGTPQGRRQGKGKGAPCWLLKELARATPQTTNPRWTPRVQRDATRVTPARARGVPRQPQRGDCRGWLAHCGGGTYDPGLAESQGCRPRRAGAGAHPACPSASQPGPSGARMFTLLAGPASWPAP